MRLVIQKYGGTSVSTLSHIESVAEWIHATQQQGVRVVVVVSAMSGVTDHLLDQAYALSHDLDPRELDRLLSTGEMVSSALLAMALQARGCPALALTGRQAGIVTDDVHTEAQIKRIDPTLLYRALDQNVTPVVAGFQGENDVQDVTALGRGGSDLTAVALAARLRADCCVLYKDVDGIYSADPHAVASAQHLSFITYDDMFEMASAGVQVLQARAVALAKTYAVPMVVKSWLHHGSGTFIGEAPRVRATRPRLRTSLEPVS